MRLYYFEQIPSFISSWRLGSKSGNFHCLWHWQEKYHIKILKDSYNNQEIKGSVDRAAEQKQDERNHIGGHFHFHHHHVHCSLSLSPPLLTFTTYTVYIIFIVHFHHQKHCLISLLFYHQQLLRSLSLQQSLLTFIHSYNTYHTFHNSSLSLFFSLFRLIIILNKKVTLFSIVVMHIVCNVLRIFLGILIVSYIGTVVPVLVHWWNCQLPC